MTQESELPEELRFEKQEPPSLYAVAGATIVVLASIIVAVILGFWRMLNKEKVVTFPRWWYETIRFLVAYAAFDIVKDILKSF